MAPILADPQQSNADFLHAHAAPARIGLAGGSALIDRGIRKAQRLITADAADSAWSHAFLFGEQRSDGLVGLAAHLGVIFEHVVVGIPAVGVAGVKLHEPHTPLDEPPGQKAARAEF